MVGPQCNRAISSCVGHVTWVGTSSAESTLCLEQLVGGEWVKITDAVFVLVARDPLNRGPAFINPLELVMEVFKIFLPVPYA